MDLWIIFWRGNYPLYFIFLNWLLVVLTRRLWSLIHRSDDNSKSLIHVLDTANGVCILQFHMQWRKLLQLLWHFGSLWGWKLDMWSMHSVCAVCTRVLDKCSLCMYSYVYVNIEWTIKLKKAIDGQRAVVNLLFC